MNKQTKELFEDYDEMVKEFPNEPITYFCRGIDRLRKGEFESAVNDFNEVIKANSGYYVAYYLRGRAYCFLKQPEQAISDYKKALDLKPDFTFAKTALDEV